MFLGYQDVYTTRLTVNVPGLFLFHDRNPLRILNSAYSILSLRMSPLARGAVGITTLTQDPELNTDDNAVHYLHQTCSVYDVRGNFHPLLSRTRVFTLHLCSAVTQLCNCDMLFLVIVRSLPMYRFCERALRVEHAIRVDQPILFV